MKDCTYYDLLGIPMDADDAAITNAKNFLVKKMHPDANVGSSYDTTLYIQKILDAYHILIDPKKRRVYDRRIHNPIRREQGPSTIPYEKERGPLSPNFAPFWEAANKLNELVVMSQSIQKKKRFGKQELTEEQKTQLGHISREASLYIEQLNSGKIPKAYWYSYSMNWLLFQWSQHRDLSYAMLFAMYDSYLEDKKTPLERRKILRMREEFLTELAKLERE